MRTPAQQQASRTNGAHSSGPVTPEGKAQVSQNGTTHGVYAKRVVVKGEDPQAFDHMHQGLLQTWQPVNDFEADLITDIAEARWRLARFLSLTSEALDLQVEMMRPMLAEDWPNVPTGTRYVLAFNEAISRNRTLEVLESAIAKQHRIINLAIRNLIHLRKLRGELQSPEVQAAPAETAPDTDGAILVTPAQLAEMVEKAVEAKLAAAANNTQPRPAQPDTANRKSKPEPVATAAPVTPAPTENYAELRPDAPKITAIPPARPRYLGPDRLQHAA